MKGCRCTCRLCPISLGLALGIVSALWMAIFAWTASYTGHGVAMVAQWGEIYQGYAATVKGGWVGAAWGFAEGFVTGLVLALVYDFVLCCCKSLCKSDDSCDSMKKSKK